MQTILSMAKNGKKTFRESAADYAALAARIAERRFEPLYLLMGDEPYFIDSLSNRGSACRGEYVPGPCTHRPSHHESREHPKSVA